MPDWSNPRVFEIWREKLPVILNDPHSGTLHTICVSENWFAVIQSLVGELERREAWVGSDEEIDTTIQYVLRIEAGADCREVVVERVETVLRETVTQHVGASEDEDEDMACVTCIKRIRRSPETGILQVSYYTEVECADCWIDVADVPLADILSNVGDALVDSSGRARDAAQIRFNKSLVNKDQKVLRACAKATAIVDLMIETAKAFYGLNDTWHSLGNTFSDWFDKVIPRETLKYALTALLPEVMLPIVSVSEAIQALLGLSEDEINALGNETFENYREALICELSSVLTTAEALTSEELVAVADRFARRSLIDARVFLNVTKSWDFLAFRNYLWNTSEDVDCGCSQIVSSQTGVPTLPPGADYDWSKVIDFVVNDYSPEIVTIISEPEGLQGVYVPEYGYRDVWTSAAGGDWRRLRLNVDMAQGVYVTSIDVHGEFERGLLRENTPGSPLSNINQNIYFGGSVQRFTNTPSTGVLRWNGLAQIDQFQANTTIGYDEVDGGSGDPGGLARFTKIVIRGLGTVPSGLAALPDEE